jgi:serine/threonine protein kinase
MNEAGPGHPNSPLSQSWGEFEASPGSLIAERYCLLSKLGQGGMSTVWRAEDRALRIEVALKLIEPSLVDSPVALARFQQEAHAAAKLRSTHIVHINDYGLDEVSGQPFIAMDLLEGESLQQRLERMGTLSFTETQHILMQVARALELAHSKGIAHRDLKPENIFIAREGDSEIVKVLDFGIAKRLDVMTVSGGLKTREGQMLGTPNYMSPEQARARGDIDQRTDVWAFGVIAFECITGIRPFESDNLASLVLAICSGPIPDPASLAATPAGFTEWFEHAIARDVQDRFATIVAAASELSRLADAPLTSPHGGVATLAAFTAPASLDAKNGPAPARLPRGRWLVPKYRGRGLALVAVVLSIGALCAWWLAKSDKPASSALPAVPAASLTSEPIVNAVPSASEPAPGVTLAPESNPSAPASEVAKSQGTQQSQKSPVTDNTKRPASPKPVNPSPAIRRTPAPQKANPLDPGI